MIYRIHKDGTKYVYILTTDAYSRHQVFQQQLNEDDRFTGQATTVRGNRLGIGKKIIDASGWWVLNLEQVDKLLTTPKTVVNIHDDHVEMKKGRAA